jgi:hypothetical protein
MKKRNLVLAFAVSTLLVSCGKGKNGGSKSQKAVALKEQVSEGNYRAILRSLNNSLSGFIPTGVAEISITQDEAKVMTLLDDDARVTHLQSIHVGTRCPELRDDRNKDGLIDIKEAYAVVGKVLIPLDGDLSSAEEGANLYPVGSGFTYSEAVSLSELETDVRSRLKQNLNLAGRVILMHGVNGGTPLPETVQTMGTMLKQASIPIVCGVIARE